MKIKFGMIFLIMLIIFNIGDFFDILPGDIDFIEKLFGIAGFTILFYMANLTDIFFGTKHKMLDIWILIACFALMMKDFVAYIETSLDVGNFVIPYAHQVFIAVQTHAVLIEQISFYFGIVMLFLIAIVAAIDCKFRSPSIMHMLHEDFPPTNIWRIIVRFISVYIILLSFFILVFNLAIQWLTVALDAPQLMLLILVYAALFIWHKATLRTETVIHKLGELGIDFYERFIRLFHYKKTFFFGLTGLLVLHSLQEIGVFLSSYITGIFDPLYLERLRATAQHIPLGTLIGKDMSGASFLIEKICIAWVYAFNILAIVLLLLIPVFAWYTLFKKKELHIPQIFLAFIYTALFVFLIMPCFGLIQLGAEQDRGFIYSADLREYGLKESVLGVDILTKSIMENNFATVILGKIPVSPAISTTVLSILIFLFVLIYDLKREHRKTLYLASVYYGLAFFGYYLFLFSSDLIRYYYETVTLYLGLGGKLLAAGNYLSSLGNYFFVIYFGIFLVITALFYLIGYAIFLWEVYNEHMYEKWSREVE